MQEESVRDKALKDFIEARGKAEATRREYLKRNMPDYVKIMEVIGKLNVLIDDISKALSPLIVSSQKTIEEANTLYYQVLESGKHKSMKQ